MARPATFNIQIKRVTVMNLERLENINELSFRINDIKCDIKYWEKTHKSLMRFNFISDDDFLLFKSEVVKKLKQKLILLEAEFEEA